MILSTLLAAPLLVSAAPPQQAPPRRPRLVSKATGPQHYVGSTVKILQVSDDVDKPRRTPTLSRSASKSGLTGTDLGSSFEHKGKLWFLFGDSRGRPGDKDAVAWSDSTSPDELAVNFHVGRDGKFLPINVPGVGMGAYEVPSHGISVNDVMYMVSTAGHTREKTMLKSLLSRSDNDGRSWQVLHELSNDAFINVALVRAKKSDHASLPADDVVLFFGSGHYRRSNPKLAYVPAPQFGRKPAMRYFTGLRDGVPQWSPQEAQAKELFNHPVIGEITVSWVAPIKRWVMLYQGKRPAGILMRTAEQPWGPWTEPQCLLDAWNDYAYANFLHAGWKSGRKDNFHDAGLENRWGGPYAPFIIDRFTKGDETRCTIYYTMSTWNPYQVVLMSSDVGYPDRAPQLEFKETTLVPGGEGWITSADFTEVFTRNDVRHVTTRKRGGAEMGVTHTAIEPTPDATLDFTYHGGNAEIVLVRDTSPPPRRIPDVKRFYRELKNGLHGEVVEATVGPMNDDVDVEMHWNLHRHVGQRLRLYVIDARDGRWGFINVSEMRLRSSLPPEPR